MIRTPLWLISTLALCGTSSGAHASSSAWASMEGGRLRLVTTGEPDASGTLKGVLEVDLAPGWKTYWRDPGDAGVPPTVDISASRNVADATVAFPAPQRHHDGTFSWAGYDGPVAFPISFRLHDVAAPVSISANIFLGVCESICVPVQAELSVDPSADPRNPGDRAIVGAAFAMLPRQASDSFGLQLVEENGGQLLLEATVPAGEAALDVFIAGDGAYTFREPRRIEKDGRTFFAVETVKPEARPAGDGLDYTLVTDNGAVSGLLPYF